MKLSYETKMANQYKQLTLMLTWNCDISCEHCCQEHLKIDVTEQRVAECIEYFAKNATITRVNFTGGEAFLRYNTLLRLSETCLKYNLNFGIVTNANWAISVEKSIAKLNPLKRNGLDRIVVSFDSYHAKFVSKQKILNTIIACKQEGIGISIYSTHGNDVEKELSLNLIQEITNEENVEVISRSLLPAEAVKRYNIEDYSIEYGKLNKRCPSKDKITIWPNGEALPCCSAGTSSHLAVGNIYINNFIEIEENFKNSETLKIIRLEGLGGLVERLPEDTKQEIKSKKYCHTCHLCYNLFEQHSIRDKINHMAKSDFDIISEIIKL